MASKKKDTLSVQIDGPRRFIMVPSGRAQNLHEYLRSHKVRSAPPEPAYTGQDFIELAKDIDVGGVQAILKGWPE